MMLDAPITAVESFADRCGRTWRVEMTALMAKQIRVESGLDLSAAMTTKAGFVRVLIADPCDLWTALWVCVRDVAEDLGILEDDFGRALDADALAAGVDALLLAAARLYPARYVSEYILQYGVPLLRLGARDEVAQEAPAALGFTFV